LKALAMARVRGLPVELCGLALLLQLPQPAGVAAALAAVGALDMVQHGHILSRCCALSVFGCTVLSSRRRVS